MWSLVTLFVFSPCIHLLKRADIHHKIFFYKVVWMRMSMSCTCANLIYSLKLWSGNMYVLFHLEMWCTELWFCTLYSNYDRAYMFYFAGCWQFWTYMKTLFYHSISYIEFRIWCCSWIFLFFQTFNSLLIYPPILEKAHPPPMNNIFMPKMHSVYSQWVWLSISIIRKPVMRDFWNWVICTVNQNRSFIWYGKPPKWRKEILEGKIHHGGLKLHNLPLFDKALELSWLKRYIKSNSKWTVFPNNFELWDVFTYVSEFLSVILLANRCGLGTGLFFIKNTPVWLSPTFSIPINRDWFNKCISTDVDFLGTMNVIRPMEEFMTTHNVKPNVLDYKSITIKIKKYIKWNDMNLYEETALRNSSLNVILDLSVKGVSKLYIRMKDSFSHVLDNVVDQWREHTDIEIESFSLSRSFQKYHLKYQDTYLKYI